MVLVHDGVAAAEAGEGGDRTRTRRSLAAPEQPVFRQNRELELWGEEALAQARGGKHHAGLVRRGAVKELGTDACEVVLRPLALPAPGPSHHRPVSRPDQLLKLRLGLPQRLRRRIRTLGAENVGLIADDRDGAQFLKKVRDKVPARYSSVKTELVREVKPEGGEENFDLTSH